MSKEIDWSKAPQWADRVLAMGMAGAWAWANEHQYQYIGKINKEIFLYEEENTWNLSDGELVEMRHSVETWTGQGLPPVGTVCEIQHGSLGWTRCEIVAHKVMDSTGVTMAIAWIDANTLDQSQGIRFRPIRTQAQIEAEEREKSVADMLDKFRFGEDKQEILRAVCFGLYDAGYRKTEAGK